MTESKPTESPPSPPEYQEKLRVLLAKFEALDGTFSDVDYDVDVDENIEYGELFVTISVDNDQPYFDEDEYLSDLMMDVTQDVFGNEDKGGWFRYVRLGCGSETPEAHPSRFTVGIHDTGGCVKITVVAPCAARPRAKPLAKTHAPKTAKKAKKAPR